MEAIQPYFSHLAIWTNTFRPNMTFASKVKFLASMIRPWIFLNLNPFSHGRHLTKTIVCLMHSRPYLPFWRRNKIIKYIYWKNLSISVLTDLAFFQNISKGTNISWKSPTKCIDTGLEIVMTHGHAVFSRFLSHQ